MFQIPPVSDIALALTIVGALFLVRFLLAIRRLRRTAGREAIGSVWEDTGRVNQTNAFGPDLEPERRYALRQFMVGATFSAIGLAAAGWMLVANVLGPFVDQAAGN